MIDEKQISKIRESIISVLNYFGLFSYPLTDREIHRFLSYRCTFDEVSFVINEMVNSRELTCSDKGFYSIQNHPEWTLNRITGNNRAEELLNRTDRYVKTISRFPYVRAIAISGSLSKYYADEEGDIDYFIITKKNRLWIARTLLHFYKKFTFLRGNEHYYCMNYFVDETALEIDQKNIYAAIETVTLIPVYNKQLISKLKDNNTWVADFLPNETYNEDLRFLIDKRKESLKIFFEKFMEFFNASAINRKLMTITDKKWRRKWNRKGYPMESYDQAFYTTINISKNHPANFQYQILDALENEKKKLTKDHPVCSL